MAFSASTPFPYQITPLTNIVPFTYRDGTTYLETLEKLRVWLNNSLVPEFNAGIDNAIKEFLRGIANAENRVVESEEMHKKLVSDTLISVAASVKGARDYVDRITEFVNNKTGNVDIQRVALKSATTAFTVNELWPTNHPVFVAVKQDSTGNRKITFPENVRGIIDLKTEPNSVTEFTLFPDGAGNWDIVQYAGTLAGQITDATISAIMRRRNTGTDAALNSKIAETVLNVKLFGLKGDGVTDDTAAFRALISTLPSPENAFGIVSPAIYFPAGRYILDGGFTFPQRVTIKGDGAYQTILFRKANATGDFITFNGSTSMLRDLMIDGNKNSNVTGDSVVFRSAYCTIKSVTLQTSGGNGLTIGKDDGGAIAYRIESLSVRLAAFYGVEIIAGSRSTDGQWMNVGIGQCGLSGVRISNGAQNLVNVHSWGNGINHPPSEMTSDGAGFYLYSGNNKLVNCQAETNLTGFVIHGSGSVRNQLTGSYAWGNKQNGVFIREAPNTVITGGTYFNNGLSSMGMPLPQFANIRNYNSQKLSMSGVLFSDDGRSVSPGSYNTVPAYPFPGRLADTKTVSHHYIEISGDKEPWTPDFNTIVGCEFPGEETTTGVPVVTVGQHSNWAGNLITGQPTYIKETNGALYPRPEQDYMEINSTNSLPSIQSCAKGRRITIRFTNDEPGWVTTAGNIKLIADFKPTKNQTLTLMFDGENWQEIGRSLGKPIRMVSRTSGGGALTITRETEVINVTGTGTVRGIVATEPGHRVTLIFKDPTPGWVLITENIKLPAEFKAVTGQTLTLVCDGVNWYETGRSSAIVA